MNKTHTQSKTATGDRSRKAEAVFYYRGDVERWAASRRSYCWHRGYSENDPVDGRGFYPWRTKVECRQDAKTRGLKAVFIEEITKP